MGPYVDEQEFSDLDELGFTDDLNLMEEDEFQEKAPHGSHHDQNTGAKAPHGSHHDQNTGAFDSPDGDSILDPLLNEMEEPCEPGPWGEEIPPDFPGMMPEGGDAFPTVPSPWDG
jgi:hypothetical protein